MEEEDNFISVMYLIKEATLFFVISYAFICANGTPYYNEQISTRKSNSLSVVVRMGIPCDWSPFHMHMSFCFYLELATCMTMLSLL